MAPVSPSAKSVQAIKEYRDQLKEQKINLVVALIPPKALVFADKVSKKASPPKSGGVPLRCDPSIEQLAEALEKAGVNVADLTQEFLLAREDNGGLFAKASDTMTPQGARVAAERIARAVGMRGTAGFIAKEDTVQGGNELGGNPVALSVRQIYDPQGVGPVPLPKTGGSVLMITDGNGIAWARERSSLAEQLSFELQTTVSVMEGENARNAQRLSIMRQASTSKNPLRSTKCIVWCFESTALASGDWQKIPLALEFKEIDPNLRQD
jgi:alginate O-acetyltransferase complex protein AlgJ